MKTFEEFLAMERQARFMIRAGGLGMGGAAFELAHRGKDIQRQQRVHDLCNEVIAWTGISSDYAEWVRYTIWYASFLRKASPVRIALTVRDLLAMGYSLEFIMSRVLSLEGYAQLREISEQEKRPEGAPLTAQQASEIAEKLAQLANEEDGDE